MGEAHAPSAWRTAGLILAVYLAWLVTCVISGGVLITWHTALLRVYVGLHLNKWGLALYNNMVALTLVIIWLVLVIASEGWYRTSAGAGVLGRRVVRLLLGLLLFGLCGAVLGRVI